MSHIQSLHGTWVYPYGLEASKSDFFPKSGKLDYTEAKAYRPISLSSFLLKMMEKLVDKTHQGWCIEDSSSAPKPTCLSDRQIY
jgi:hypothetical protein